MHQNISPLFICTHYNFRALIAFNSFLCAVAYQCLLLPHGRGRRNYFDSSLSTFLLYCVMWWQNAHNMPFNKHRWHNTLVHHDEDYGLIMQHRCIEWFIHLLLIMNDKVPCCDHMQIKSTTSRGSNILWLASQNI